MQTEILRFNIQNAQSLMTHRLKIQIALFVDEKAKDADKYIDAMESAIRGGGFSTQVLGLYIPVNDPSNSPVLDRFFVKAGTAPCVRVAVMYPDGNGIRVYGPPTAEGPHALPGLVDGNPKTQADYSSLLKAYFAKTLKPLLRSESRPSLSHPIVTDLIGNTVDDFILTPGKHVLLMLYWTTCAHCEALQPVFESIAHRVDAAFANAPAGTTEILFGRIEGTRNDIGHRRIYAGSYPAIYFVPADDKDNPMQIDDTRQETAIWNFLEENTWLGDGQYLDKDEL